jgi:hypothetical protein
MNYLRKSCGVNMWLRKDLSLFAIVLIMLSFYTNANSLIFKCSTSNNKQITLSRDGTNFIYSFGKTGHSSEIELVRKRNQLIIDFDNVSGRYATNSIEIENDNYSYQLTTSVDRIADEQEPTTSLAVMKNRKYLTTFQCLKGSELGSLINIDN